MLFGYTTDSAVQLPEYTISSSVVLLDMSQNSDIFKSPPKALTFDVFGTVVSNVDYSSCLPLLTHSSYTLEE